MMLLKSPFLVLVASWIGTLSLFSTGGRAQSVCANWWNSLAPSQQPTSITVRLRKRANVTPARIDGSKAGRQTTFVAPGTGACGITYTDDDSGACLWGGYNAVQPPPDGQQPGWHVVNFMTNLSHGAFLVLASVSSTRSYTQNCGKNMAWRSSRSSTYGLFLLIFLIKSYINRGGQQATGTVLDSCSFEDGGNLTVEQGCSSIYVTRAHGSLLLNFYLRRLLSLWVVTLAAPAASKSTVGTCEFLLQALAAFPY
ncbi:uncharacterized protein VP01_1114g2 [Puccinia sorghi]|uniref:Uncharacterized protein n=1 Tax=Puccinia sorghi TaxID=27349 RepID=A0A0L6VTZ1_9BASI|nr:uncharacterized protein VP01_1114g2 [Puccinia sorghi]